jgi:hypothetical protein
MGKLRFAEKILAKTNARPAAKYAAWGWDGETSGPVRIGDADNTPEEAVRK